MSLSSLRYRIVQMSVHGRRHVGKLRRMECPTSAEQQEPRYKESSYLEILVYRSSRPLSKTSPFLSNTIKRLRCFKMSSQDTIEDPMLYQDKVWLCQHQNFSSS
jgi:hypothetical protein